MWKDDDRIEIAIDAILKKVTKDVPLVCPICGKKQVHYYIHKWSEQSLRGGIWVWCSQCRCFSHGTIKVPEWWENSDSIPISQLNSLPDYLEDNKHKVDSYVNNLNKGER